MLETTAVPTISPTGSPTALTASLTTLERTAIIGALGFLIFTVCGVIIFVWAMCCRERRCRCSPAEALHDDARMSQSFLVGDRKDVEPATLLDGSGVFSAFARAREDSVRAISEGYTYEYGELEQQPPGRSKALPSDGPSAPAPLADDVLASGFLLHQTRTLKHLKRKEMELRGSGAFYSISKRRGGFVLFCMPPANWSFTSTTIDGKAGFYIGADVFLFPSNMSEHGREAWFAGLHRCGYADAAVATSVEVDTGPSARGGHKRTPTT